MITLHVHVGQLYIVMDLADGCIQKCLVEVLADGHHVWLYAVFRGSSGCVCCGQSII